MKIRRCYLDGFGVFRDYDLTGLVSGLTVVLGPNEAGKTTLLNFFRWILFGSHKHLLPPLNGGRSRGRIWLETPAGEYRLDREAISVQKSQATLTRPDATTAPAGELDGLLGHATANTFASVFGFTQFELNALAELGQDQVRSQLFSAGISGAGQQATAVLKELERRREVLWKPRGGGTFRELLARLVAKREALQQARARMQQFPDADHAVKRLEEEIKDLSKRARQTAARNADLDRLVELWPTWLELESCQSELNTGPLAVSFDLDLGPPYDDLVRRRQERQDEAAELFKPIEDAQRRLAELVVDDRAIVLTPEARFLDANMELQLKNRTDLQQIRAEREGKERELAASLAEMGPDWTRLRVESLDRSLPAREAVREWEKALVEVSRAHAEAALALSVAQEEFDRANRALGDLAQRLADTEAPPDRLTLERREEALHSLRAGLEAWARKALEVKSADLAARDIAAADVDRLGAEGILAEMDPPATEFELAREAEKIAEARLVLRRAGTRVEDLLRQSDRIDQSRERLEMARAHQAERREDQLPIWLPSVALILALIAGIVALAGVARGAHAVRDSLLALALISLGSAIWLLARRARIERRLATIDRAIADQVGALRVQEQEGERLRALLAEDARYLGCNEIPDGARVDELLSLRDEAERALEGRIREQEAKRGKREKYLAALGAVRRARQTLGDVLRARQIDLEEPAGEPATALAQAVSIAKRRAGELAASLGQQSQDLAGLAQSLGLPAAPDPREVETAFAVLEAHRRLRLEYDGLAREHGGAIAACTSAQESLQLANQALAERAESLSAARAGWLAWKSDRGLPPSLSCQGTLDFFDRLRLAHDAICALTGLTERYERIAAQIGDFETRAWAFVSAAGLEVPELPEQLVQSIKLVIERIEADGQVRNHRQTYEALLKERQRQLADNQASLEAISQAIAALLTRAGAKDEDEFCRLRAQAERRQENGGRLRQIERRIQEAIGKGEHAQALRRELESGELTQWDGERTQARLRLAQIESLRDERAGDLRDATNFRDELASSANVAGLELEVNSLVSELEEARRHFAVLGLAHGLVYRTLRRFEDERQPAVLKEASRLIAPVTEGTYRLVRQDAERIIVTDAAGRDHDPADFSTGTRQQLYVCLRLALAANLAQNGIDLPVIMDDVFVNCDPDRAKELAGIVGDFAKHHQVLVLTCHPETGRMLSVSTPQVRVISLERFAGAGGPPARCLDPFQVALVASAPPGDGAESTGQYVRDGRPKALGGLGSGQELPPAARKRKPKASQ